MRSFFLVPVDAIEKLIYFVLQSTFKMNQDKYRQDLAEIKEMMNRSSRFISLSGLSGVSAGIFALLGAYAAYTTVYENQNYFAYRHATFSEEKIIQLLLIASITLVGALVTGVFFTTRESKKRKQKIWDAQSKRLLINLAIPLLSGGLFSLILLREGLVGLVAPVTLIFYGLALVNASKYTLGELRSLGLFEIVLGLIASVFIGYGLVFWAIGFGLLHIVYGFVMHFKYQQA